MNVNKAVSQVIHWSSKNTLFLMSLFLLAFIPLFPKIPLFEAIPGYIVKVRLEDLLVFLTGLIWLSEVRAKRIVWNTSYFWFVIIYALCGVSSILLGVFLLQTIPLELLHIGKSGLHFIRYLEYFSLFFFFFSAIKTRTHIVMAISVLILTLLGVIGYGLGQKYAQFPVYSTMNREYSKGAKLYLQAGARPQSTFAGHYDLASYLVIVLPIFMALALGMVRRPFQPVRVTFVGMLVIIHILGLVMLVLSGSKISLAGYAAGLSIVFVLYWMRLPTKRARVLGAAFGCLVFVTAGLGVWIGNPLDIRNKVLGVLRNVQTTQEKPVDLVGDGIQKRIVSTANPDGSITKKTILEQDTWSPNALKYGLSMGIRLDTLWPQALLGFARSPLTGSGYGTLAMLDTYGFVEADSTDNNYLRTIGETGILGFLAFYGLLLLILREALRASQTRDAFPSSLSIGLVGSIVGLLIAAVYLDVFAASKVAFSFWALAGLVSKANRLGNKEKLSNINLRPIQTALAHVRRHWPLYGTVLLAFFLLHQNPFMSHSLTKDIAENRESLEQMTAARCFVRTGAFSLCRDSGLVLRPQLTLYSVLLVPFISQFKTLGIFAYLNLMIIALSLLFTYLGLQNRVGKQSLFLGLVACVGLASFFHLSGSPLTPWQFLGVVIGFPMLGVISSKLFEYPESPRVLLLKRAVLVMLVIMLSRAALFDDLLPRFRNSSPNDAVQAVQVANGVIPSSSLTKAYLVTALNPYYSDLFSLGTYTVLPLSSHQAYADTPSKVWGISDSHDLPGHFWSILTSPARLYASNYGIDSNPKVKEDFTVLKQSFDLSHKALGCEEKCNVYSVGLPKEKISPNPESIFNTKELFVQNIPPDYQFAVVSSRFDPGLSTPSKTYSTTQFVEKLEPLKKSLFQFMIITGDATSKQESEHALLFNTKFANLVRYPVLYTSGNIDIIPEKYFQSGVLTFFTKTEYFILLDMDANSHLSLGDQLKLYDALFELEKIPQIQNLFIISHDLNWQDRSDPQNAIHILEKKLQEFPSLHTTIITANHKTTQSPGNPPYESTKNANGTITYIATLTAGGEENTYIKVQVNKNGSIQSFVEPLDL